MVEPVPSMSQMAVLADQVEGAVAEMVEKLFGIMPPEAHSQWTPDLL
jgi:hypothetical protein